MAHVARVGRKGRELEQGGDRRGERRKRRMKGRGKYVEE
jgi:hypothetical protein